MVTKSLGKVNSSGDIYFLTRVVGESVGGAIEQAASDAYPLGTLSR